jgi:sulfur carrier protein
MTVFLNDKKIEFSGPLTLKEALEQQGIRQVRGIAVAVNDRVVPKSEWETYHLQENDRILVIQATQGG